MMTTSRARGSVHIMWLIVTMMIAIIGWLLWYLQFTDNELLVKNEVSAIDEREQAQDDAVKYQSAFNKLAAVAGVGPAKLADSKPDEDFKAYSDAIESNYVRPAQDKVREARSLFEGNESMVTLAEISAPAEAMVNKLRSQISALQNEVSTVRGEKGSAEAANDTMVQDHATELQGRNDTEAGLRSRHANKESQLESQRDDVSAKFSTLTDTHEAVLTAHEASETALKNQMLNLDRDVRDVKRHLRIHQEAKKPDGRVIDVNYATQTCWIDVGSRHTLRRGTRFETYGYLKGRVKQPHGFIIVRDTELNRALCAIEGGARVKKGDFVTSPVFHRDAVKTFHFLGKLPGRFNNQRAKQILEEFNAKVADQFSTAVDFLVIGSNPDPEAVGEDADPDWYKKTDAYNNSLRWNIEQMLARDLEVFLQY